MPPVGPLVRWGRTSRGGRLILTDRIDVAVIKSIRRHLLRVKSIAEVAERANTIQARAFNLMNQMGRSVDMAGRVEGRCGRFNKYVAELLIARDYHILKDVAPIKIAYMELQMAAHHIVKASEFDKYAGAFQRLAAKTGNGWWTNRNTMPALPLFQELHGLSPETLANAHLMKNFDFNKVANFSPTLDTYLETKKQTGSFAELFEIHRDFYAEHMKSRFFKERSLQGIGDKSLEEWFDDMIKLAKEVDAEMATNP